jgi:hypothetical protein
MASVTYLNAASLEDVQDWMCAIRPHCVSQNVRAPKIDNLKVLRCIQIEVLEARHLPAKLVPSPYCIISVNQVNPSIKFEIVCVGLFQTFSKCNFVIKLLYGSAYNSF